MDYKQYIVAPQSNTLVLQLQHLQLQTVQLLTCDSHESMFVTMPYDGGSTL
jgi:hypothetical protein